MADAPTGPNPVLVDFGSPLPQRRWTVLIRIILAIPHYVVLFVVGLGAIFVTIYAWFAALVTGRVPDAAASYLSGYVRRLTRLSAYMLFLTDSYPPFSGDPAPDYPVETYFEPGPLNRLAVLFRLILVVPAAIFSGWMSTGMWMFSVITWAITLVLGRLPAPLFEAEATAIRYGTRVTAYFLGLSSQWPWGSFGDSASLQGSAADRWPPTASGFESSFPETASVASSERTYEAAGRRPLVASGGAKVLLVVFIALGVINQAILRGHRTVPAQNGPVAMVQSPSGR